jgi:prepilin-type N-terminal cleavage/methylation domain-containing protein
MHSIHSNRGGTTTPCGGVPVRRGARSRRGMTLLEILVAMPIILVAGFLLVSTLTAATRQRALNGENARAAEVLRATIETLRNEDLGALALAYDPDPLNDPMGPGTAPGSSFDIPGLRPVEGDPDGRVGEILLPLIDAAPAGSVLPQWQVREDAVLPELGMPRDLNGDDRIDDLDHTGDYRILPVLVRARWQGQFGPRTLRVFTSFTEFLY